MLTRWRGSQVLRGDDLEGERALQDDAAVSLPDRVDHGLDELVRGPLERVAERGGDRAFGEAPTGLGADIAADDAEAAPPLLGSLAQRLQDAGEADTGDIGADATLLANEASGGCR